MIKVGSVVLVTAGKEKGMLFAVIGFSKERLMITDGRTRRLNKPKTKSAKHISDLGISLNETAFSSNRELRRAISLISSDITQSL